MADIQNSHLVPKAMYKYAVDPKTGKPNTVIVNKKGSFPVVKQVTGHLLCWDCEQRIRNKGEDWMMCHVWNGKTTRFPLLDTLNVAVPVRPFGDALLYSATACGIDADQLAYFALSVLWRGAAREWRTGQDSVYRITLGAYEEPIRRFLAGRANFPQDVSVTVTVCTDIYSRLFYLPTPVKFPQHIIATAFDFVALGVRFLMVTDKAAPKVICCVGSPEKAILKRDCSSKAIASVAHLPIGRK
ncbi:MAG: hypothetical protein ACRD19_09235 [Terriglobia bacterium]